MKILLFLICAMPALALWQDEIPENISQAYLRADRVLSEVPCDWRETLGNIFRPLVQDCTTAREAALAISSQIGDVTGAYYSIERRKPDMNALEALQEKKISCTGQTILLVCAFRSVGLPARAVGIYTWNHIRGNHTWAEVWYEGEWHMIEFNEKEFNTPWVMENIGMIDPSHPQQRIMAVCGDQASRLRFPLPWPGRPIPAEDVTERYLQLASDWYADHGVPADKQRIMLDIKPRPQTPTMARLVDQEGKLLQEIPLPTTSNDVRYMSTFDLPRTGQFFLYMPGNPSPLHLEASSGPVRILRLIQK